MDNSFNIKNKRKTAVYELKMLTPVHIGSGQQLEKGLDYFYAKAKKSMKIINEEKLYKELNRHENSLLLLEALKSYYTNTEFKSNELSNLFSSDIYDGEIPYYGYPNANKIAEHINQNSQYYVPGSTIKGAFRTALLYCAMKRTNSLNKKAIFKILGNETLVKPYIRDSKNIPLDDMSVVGVTKYFRTDKKYNKRKIELNLMVIDKEVTTMMDLSYDQEKNVIHLFEAMNKFIIGTIDREIELYKNNKIMIDYLNNFKRKASQYIEEGNKRTLLRIGKEKGFNYNTVHSAFDINLSNKLYSEMVKKPKNVHPLLISKIEQNNKCFDMLGWCELSKVGEN